jgi:TRAP-type C4-dicarboxylate transport system permease small subunit
VRAAHAVERFVGTLVEVIAALLIATEIGILLAGVISRYFLNTPLTWTDEAASLFFLWLACLGAVVALRRGEHMRMTALVAKMTAGNRALCDTIGWPPRSPTFCSCCTRPSISPSRKRW